VALDPLINGETGVSMIALSAFNPDDRRAYNYWMALAAMVVLLALVFLMLRGRLGTSVQAIRDDEDAAESVGVRVLASKRTIFFLASFGCALAGTLWLATSITFQPRQYFGVQWTAYMIFMVLVGGLGTFEGPIVGAVIYFLIEYFFGQTGVWYLIGLGAAAVIFALFLPRGIWGTLEQNFGIRLLPIGYRLRMLDSNLPSTKPEGPCRAKPIRRRQASNFAINATDSFVRRAVLFDTILQLLTNSRLGN
jgi:branched-chain amino acid transport system permease protein